MVTETLAAANTFAAELKIVDGRGRANYYRLAPLAADPAVARVAWRLVRLEEEEDAEGKRKRKPGTTVYDVMQAAEGHWSCDCPGFLKWDHCKHVRVLCRLLGGSLPEKSQAKKSTLPQEPLSV